MTRSLPLLAGIVLTGGCRSLLGIEEASIAADAAPDVPSDVTPDASPSECYGAEPFVICLTTMPTQIVNLSGQTINTDFTCDLVYAHGTTSWCVHVATELTVSGKVSATGSRPLVLLGTDRLAILSTGNIDVASRRAPTLGGVAGAGARGGTCSLGSNGINNAGGGGGGAGGSFGTRGGNGGAGNGGVVSPGTAGLAITSPPDQLRGGCSGTLGGAGSGNNDNAGDGGGAVYLLAGRLLEIDGEINASGAGGGGGRPSNGGGGGAGSGGLIVLWSPEIRTGNATPIFANGGGGGGGADASVSGSSGTEATSPTSGGSGGPSASGSGPGGDGNTGAGNGQPGGPAFASGGGGGGGGGGAGVILVLSGQSTLGGNISPPPTL